MKNKGKFFKKLLSATIAIGIFASFLANNVVAVAGGPGDPRSHQFLHSLDPANTEDEGYRWRNSFDFTIGGKQIISWKFNKDGSRFDQNSGGSNGIHEELSKIISAVTKVPNHKAVAAVTIVVRNPTTQSLEAYSEVVCERKLSQRLLPKDEGTLVPAIAIPATNKGLPDLNLCWKIRGKDKSMYYTCEWGPDRPTLDEYLLDFANNVGEAGIGINVNIPSNGQNVTGGGYSCCEGQIVARLLTNPKAYGKEQSLEALFPQTIKHLLNESKADEKNIVLVVLHIHNHCDPCAKCAKVLAALSQLMNTTVPAVVSQTFPALADNLQNGNARFLIEVSSNGTYTISDNNGASVSSQAEASGLDANIADPIDITLGSPIICGSVGNVIVIGGDIVAATTLNPLAIPNNLTPAGAPTTGNFIFQNTFPPYVVFGRIGPNGLVAPVAAHPAGRLKPPVI